MQRAARLEPGNRDRWMALAGMALATGDLQRTLEGWQRARQLRADPALDNNLAWVYATHPRRAVRNGREALRLATAACEATRYGVRPYLDTLAAAQAETGDFEAAVDTMQRSLSLATDDAALRDRLQARRQLYASRRPFRDTTLP
jgi:tetratricopeptide (TPR) repeat protein